MSSIPSGTPQLLPHIHPVTNEYAYKSLFGVTTLDVVRASTFVAEILGNLSLSKEIVVPVVGGHSGVTVCTYLSRFNV